MEKHQRTSNLDVEAQPAEPMLTLDAMRYNSARWWRNLNRGMSIVGLLVLGAIIALIVIGMKQQWGS